MKALLAMILFCCLRPGFSKELNAKYWIPNTNFDDPKNWNLKRVPCERDRVIFPSGLELGVTLPGPGVTKLRELVLPRTGELFLPNDGALLIEGDATPQDSSKCKGEDIEFARHVTESWFNPRNWYQKSSDFLPGQVDQIPHTDRIPCYNSLVVFQQHKSYRLQLPDVAVKVGMITFGDQVMSNAEWRDFLKSESGYRQFVGVDETRDTAITIQTPSGLCGPDGCECNDKTDCACFDHANSELILERVCSFVYCETTLPCYAAVTPYGHCCPMCGAYLLIEYDNAFRIEGLLSLVKEQTRAEPNVLSYTKKTAFVKDVIQVILSEKNAYDGSSVKLAAVLQDEIIKDMDLGVRKVTVHSAGPTVLGSKLVHAVRTVFATFFAVVIILALLYYGFIIYQNGTPFGSANYQLLQFARFENAPVDEEPLLTIGNNVNTVPPAVNDEASSSKAFDNPMYGASTGVEEKGTGFDSVSGSKHGEMTHENPVYTELKRREEMKTVESDNDEEEVKTDVEEDEDKFDDREFHEILIDKDD